MGVLTGFTRVPPELVARLRRKPALNEVLRGASDEGPEALGLKKKPDSMDIDKAWEDILAMLSGASEGAAYQALSRASELETNDGVWVRTYTAVQVKKGAAAFAKIDLVALRKYCVDHDVHGYDEPLNAENGMLDYALHHFERLRKFWAKAAKADEAIVADTS